MVCWSHISLVIGHRDWKCKVSGFSVQRSRSKHRNVRTRPCKLIVMSFTLILISCRRAAEAQRPLAEDVASAIKAANDASRSAATGAALEKRSWGWAFGKSRPSSLHLSKKSQRQLGIIKEPKYFLTLRNWMRETYRDCTAMGVPSRRARRYQNLGRSSMISGLISSDISFLDNHLAIVVLILGPELRIDSDPISNLSIPRAYICKHSRQITSEHIKIGY